MKSRQKDVGQRNLLQMLSRRSPAEGANVISQDVRLQAVEWWGIFLCSYHFMGIVGVVKH